jgi:hypothetical protein
MGADNASLVGFTITGGNARRAGGCGKGRPPQEERPPDGQRPPLGGCGGQGGRHGSPTRGDFGQRGGNHTTPEQILRMLALVQVVVCRTLGFQPKLPNVNLNPKTTRLSLDNCIKKGFFTIKSGILPNNGYSYHEYKMGNIISVVG